MINNAKRNNRKVVLSFWHATFINLSAIPFHSVYKLSCAIKYLKSRIFSLLTTELSCFDAKLLVISG